MVSAVSHLAYWSALLLRHRGRMPLPPGRGTSLTCSLKEEILQPADHWIPLTNIFAVVFTLLSYNSVSLGTYSLSSLQLFLLELIFSIMFSDTGFNIGQVWLGNDNWGSFMSVCHWALPPLYLKIRSSKWETFWKIQLCFRISVLVWPAYYTCWRAIEVRSALC